MMPRFSTSAGLSSPEARSMAMLRSTASGVSSLPLRTISISSLNSFATSSISASGPLTVISLPRTWMSPVKARSTTCTTSSRDPRSPPMAGPPAPPNLGPRLARRPPQVAAAQYVGVHVEDGLTGLRAGVEHHPVAGLGDALGGGDLVCLEQQRGQEFRVGGGQRGDIAMVDPGDHENVGGRLRVDVPEGQCAPGLPHHLGRDVPSDDLAE